MNKNMNNNHVQKSPIAFLIMNKGLSNLEVAQATTKAASLWSQMGTIWAYNLFQSMHSSALLGKKRSFEFMFNDEPKTVKLPGLDEMAQNFNELSNMTVLWQSNGMPTKSVEFEPEKYKLVCEKVSQIERRLELKGSNLKVMDYGEGVCFVAPTSVDGPLYTEFKAAIFN